MEHVDATGKIEQQLEPAALEMYSKFNTEHGIQASIAISLKRIADIMDGSCKEFTPLDKLAAAAVIYKDNNEDSY